MLSMTTTATTKAEPMRLTKTFNIDSARPRQGKMMEHRILSSATGHCVWVVARPHRLMMRAPLSRAPVFMSGRRASMMRFLLHPSSLGNCFR